MNSNQTNYRDDTIEIDLLSLLKRLLIQWRAIISIGILMGVLVGGWQFVKDRNTYKTQLAQSKNGTLTLTAGLTDDEVLTVQQAALQQQEIDELEEYSTKSLLMQVDALNHEEIKLLYSIQTQSGNATNVLALYREMLTSSSSAKQIIQDVGIDSDEKYIPSLIQVSDARKYSTESAFIDDTNVLMTVEFLIPENIDASKVQTSIEGLITRYNPENAGITTNATVTEISAEIITSADIELQNKQQQLETNLTNLKAAQKTTRDSLNDSQKALFEKLTGKTASEQDQTNDKLQVVVQEPSWSMKYTLIGILLGIILYIGIYMAYMLLRPQVTDITMMGSVPQLEQMVLGSTKKAWYKFFTYDSLLDSHLYKREGKVEDRSRRALVCMKSYAKNPEQGVFQLVTVGFGGKDIVAVKTLQKEAEKEGLTLELVESTAKHPEDLIRDASFELPTVLVIASGISRKHDISFIEKMFIGRDTELLGRISLI
ncbi:MAG: hypothetical protein SPK77_09610 [Lachnospiraceae bacterium]|nr:hypothetical protein [Lachnospiraceae bacterium]